MELTLENLSELTPLADRMRPKSLNEVVGQEHLVGHGKVLQRAIEQDSLQSFILWGPPGTGKTTIAKLVASSIKAQFINLSAVTSGIKEVKETMKSAEQQQTMFHRKTILFIDEIHRFNKSQQDAFLPYVEKGIIIFIGATTENPSFEVNSALLSRCQVYVLNPLSEEQLSILIDRALEDSERGLGFMNLTLLPDAKKYITSMSNGDARVAMNTLELSAILAVPDKNQQRIISVEIVQQALQKRVMLYDKTGEEHYNLISALHKSIRGSDPDGAVYWLARMLESGEDPLYIARRVVRTAVEDIGNAAPNALSVALAAKEAVDFLGLPEGNLALAQAVIYLACAPKSNAVYAAYSEAVKDVHEKENMPVPLHLRNAPTTLMKKLDYGKDYKYAHNYSGHFVEQEYLPENLAGRTYYQPDGQGYEAEILKRMDQWRKKTHLNSSQNKQ